MRPRPIRVALCLVAAVACTAVPAASQSILNGGITGRVTAPDGSPVSRASITLRSLDLTLERSTSADNDGRFGASFVIPGRYEVRVEALGFVPLVIAPVTVSMWVGMGTPRSEPGTCPRGAGRAAGYWNRRGA